MPKRNITHTFNSDGAYMLRGTGVNKQTELSSKMKSFLESKYKLGFRQTGLSEEGTGRSSLTCVTWEVRLDDVTVPSGLKLHLSMKQSPFHFNSFLLS